MWDQHTNKNHWGAGVIVWSGHGGIAIAVSPGAGRVDLEEQWHAASQASQASVGLRAQLDRWLLGGKQLGGGTCAACAPRATVHPDRPDCEPLPTRPLGRAKPLATGVAYTHPPSHNQCTLNRRARAEGCMPQFHMDHKPASRWMIQAHCRCCVPLCFFGLSFLFSVEPQPWPLDRILGHTVLLGGRVLCKTRGQGFGPGFGTGFWDRDCCWTWGGLVTGSDKVGDWHWVGASDKL